MKREELKEQNRRRILQAATELMIQQGIAHTSIKEVSEKSGISFVTMYKYFDSKETLTEEVVYDFQKQHLDQLLEEVTNKDLSFKEMIRVFEKNQQELEELLGPEGFEEFRVFGQKSERISVYFKEMQQQLVTMLIMAGRVSGVIHTKASNQSIMMLVSWLMEYIENRHEELTENQMADLETLFMYGLAGKDEHKRK